MGAARSSRRRGGAALRGRGTVMVYAILALIALVAICSLAVDWGRVQLTRTELQRTADAAARYAVNGIGDGTALAKANWIGARNLADGRTVTFPSSDVEPGTWDATAGTFTAGGGSPNAVRVTARLTVPNSFGATFGLMPSSLTVVSVAQVNITGFGLVGLNYVKLGGNATASYWSGGGGSMVNNGNVGSNGSITASGSATIRGDAYYGPGMTVSGASVTGTKKVLSTPLAFPNGDAGAYAYTNDDGNVPLWATSSDSFVLGNNKSLTLPGGVYYCNNFTTSSKSALAFTGPATIYCYGTFSMSGSTGTYGNLPGNLTIIMCMKPDGSAPGALTISGSSDLYASVYAPQSPVTLGGSGAIYGSVLGLSVDMTGTSDIYYDLGLNVNNGQISLTQ